MPAVLMLCPLCMSILLCMLCLLVHLLRSPARCVAGTCAVATSGARTVHSPVHPAQCTTSTLQEYYLVLEDQQSDAPSSSSDASSGDASSSSSSSGSPLARLQAAVAGALAAPEFLVQRSGGKKRGRRAPPTQVDLKWALQEMQACTPAAAAAAGVPLEVLPAPGSSKAVVRVRTACANGNPVLTPAMAVDMLNIAAVASGSSGSSSVAAAAEPAEESAAAAQDGSDGSGGAAASSGRYALAHLHRSEIKLRPMTVPQPDWVKLRSLCR